MRFSISFQEAPFASQTLCHIPGDEYDVLFAARYFQMCAALLPSEEGIVASGRTQCCHRILWAQLRWQLSQTGQSSSMGTRSAPVKNSEGTKVFQLTNQISESEQWSSWNTYSITFGRNHSIPRLDKSERLWCKPNPAVQLIVDCSFGSPYWNSICWRQKTGAVVQCN